MVTMQTAFILAVALGVAVVMVILTLVVVIVYQHWRINDSNVHLEKFISETIALREKLRRLESALDHQSPSSEETR